MAQSEPTTIRVGLLPIIRSIDPAHPSLQDIFFAYTKDERLALWSFVAQMKWLWETTLPCSRVIAGALVMKYLSKDVRGRFDVQREVRDDELVSYSLHHPFISDLLCTLHLRMKSSEVTELLIDLPNCLLESERLTAEQVEKHFENACMVNSELRKFLEQVYEERVIAEVTSAPTMREKAIEEPQSRDEDEWIRYWYEKNIRNEKVTWEYIGSRVGKSASTMRGDRKNRFDERHPHYKKRLEEALSKRRRRRKKRQSNTPP